MKFIEHLLQFDSLIFTDIQDSLKLQQPMNFGFFQQVVAIIKNIFEANVYLMKVSDIIKIKIGVAEELKNTKVQKFLGYYLDVVDQTLNEAFEKVQAVNKFYRKV